MQEGDAAARGATPRATRRKTKPQCLLTPDCSVPDCAVPGDTVWGVDDTTTHRRKEMCGGQKTFDVRRSQCLLLGVPWPSDAG